MTSAAEIATDRLNPREALSLMQSGGVLLDVRGFDEFAAAHASGAVCVPLPDLERRAGTLPADRAIVCICDSGSRSQMAVQRLRSLGIPGVTDVRGGTKGWIAAGLPTQKQRGIIPLERQVRGVAGLLVFSLSLLGLLVSPAFFWGVVFIGFMLTATSLLGICPMMQVLKLLPWNRAAAACVK